MKIKMKKQCNRGTAMLAVLVFITLVLILGAGVLTLADAAIKQSRALSVSDNAFYSVESALHVYAQLVGERVRGVTLISASHEIAFSKLEGPEIETLRSKHLTNIKTDLKDIYDAIIPAAGGTIGIDIIFYIDDVRLDLDDLLDHTFEELGTIGDTQDRIKAEFDALAEDDPEIAEFEESEIWTMVAFYPTKAITYDITANKGGRTFVASVGGPSSIEPGAAESSASGSGAATPDFGDPVFIRPTEGREARDEVLYFGSYDGGAYFKNNNTNVYQALVKNAGGNYVMNGTDYTWETIEAIKKQQAYNGLIDQLNYVISETDALTKERVLGGVSGEDTLWQAGTIMTAEYIRVTGNYTLTGSYPNLKHLEVVNGNLTISGSVRCPKLIGVFVQGGSGAYAITISEGTDFIGNISNGGTTFLTKGRDIMLSTSSSTVTRLINGKFLASGGNILINASGNTNNESNSMFVATKNGNSAKGMLTTTGQNFRMAAYTAEQVPQYYAENDLKLHVQNSNASFEGIFATLSDNYIFDGSMGNRNLRGIFVGNCGNLAGNIRVMPFNPAQQGKMLPGGLFDAEGDGYIYIPGEEEVFAEDGRLTIVINGLNFDGVTRLNIRETTGDKH